MIGKGSKVFTLRTIGVPIGYVRGGGCVVCAAVGRGEEDDADEVGEEGDVDGVIFGVKVFQVAYPSRSAIVLNARSAGTLSRIEAI
jgi:hypothetical protein